jgi:hypothetical protein
MTPGWPHCSDGYDTAALSDAIRFSTPRLAMAI